MPEPTTSAIPVNPAQAFSPKPIKFVHEKTAQYRIYHADSSWGVINSNIGTLQIDFCVEHPPTPTAVIHPVKPDGSYTGEMTMKGLDDKDYFVVVREFQFGVILSPIAAVQLRSVLDTFINKFQEQVTEMEKDKKSQ